MQDVTNKQRNLIRKKNRYRTTNKCASFSAFNSQTTSTISYGAAHQAILSNQNILTCNGPEDFESPTVYTSLDDAALQVDYKPATSPLRGKLYIKSKLDTRMPPLLLPTTQNHLDINEDDEIYSDREVINRVNKWLQQNPHLCVLSDSPTTTFSNITNAVAADSTVSVVSSISSNLESPFYRPLTTAPLFSSNSTFQPQQTKRRYYNHFNNDNQQRIPSTPNSTFAQLPAQYQRVIIAPNSNPQYISRPRHDNDFKLQRKSKSQLCLVYSSLNRNNIDQKNDHR